MEYLQIYWWMTIYMCIYIHMYTQKYLHIYHHLPHLNCIIVGPYHIFG